MSLHYKEKAQVSYLGNQGKVNIGVGEASLNFDQALFYNKIKIILQLRKLVFY
jgi:hypothetical protein